MRLPFLAALALFVSVAVPFCAQASTDQTIVVTPAPLIPDMPAATVSPPAPVQAVSTTPWSTMGPRSFGQNYQVYIPMEFKSNAPETVRSWDPAGYPRNGNQLTPQGDSCATDADCRSPMGCFARADSGQLPVRVCAFPPGY